MKKSSNSYTAERTLKMYIDEKHVKLDADDGELEISYKLMLLDMTPCAHLISVESPEETKRIFIDNDEKSAHELFTLMYENGVTPTGAKEVCQDFFFALNS